MITREDIMIENIAIKRIGFLNKKQREYTEYKLVQQAQNDKLL